MTEGEKADSFLRQTQDRRFARNDRKEGYGEDRGGMMRGLTIATITSSGPGKYRGGQRGNDAGGWKRDQRSLVPLYLCDVHPGFRSRSG